MNTRMKEELSLNNWQSISTLFYDGWASHSYLAVLKNNGPARKLYAKIGYSEIYNYWYRVRESI